MVALLRLCWGDGWPNSTYGKEKLDNFLFGELVLNWRRRLLEVSDRVRFAAYLWADNIWVMGHSTGAFEDDFGGVDCESQHAPKQDSLWWISSHKKKLQADITVKAMK